MRDQVSFYLDRARAATRAGAIGAACRSRPGARRHGARLRQDPSAKSISRVDCPDNLRFMGEKQDFDDMAGNLIDNACKWARERGAGEGRALPSGGQERMFFRATIDDDGPGLGGGPPRRGAAAGTAARRDQAGLRASACPSSTICAAAYGGRLELAIRRSAACGRS